MRYSPERKEAVLKKMMPPHNRSVKQLARQEKISENTLYKWRKEARAKGMLKLMPKMIFKMKIKLNNAGAAILTGTPSHYSVNPPPLITTFW